ncbi:MAG: hypothetical protein LBT08_04115 [Synergistaceae bacterium]|jgi:type III restriction enzyme|nr:hypothetical protein [Synergistaceae bacterium]
MKLQFKHQKFQADAAKAVCDVFAGQPYMTPSYMIDKGFSADRQMTLFDAEDFTGFGNARIVPELNEGVILERTRNDIKKSDRFLADPTLRCFFFTSLTSFKLAHLFKGLDHLV